MRARLIYEKFTEDSDPIKDLGIGLNVKRNFDNIEQMDQWIVDNLPYILETTKIPTDIIKSRGTWFPDKYDKKISNYITKYLAINNKTHNEFSWYRMGIQQILKKWGLSLF